MKNATMLLNTNALVENALNEYYNPFWWNTHVSKRLKWMNYEYKNTRKYAICFECRQ